MKKILIFGYGGHAAVVQEACEEMGYSVEFFLAEEELKASAPEPLGKLISVVRGDRIDPIKLGVQDIALGLGNNDARLWWCEKLLQDGFNLPPIIHPHSWVSPSAKLGKGTFVGAGAILQASCQTGLAVLINSNATVEHHGKLSDGCHIGPGAILAGLVEVGRLSLIGAGAVVRDRVKVGNLVTVGIGAAVINNILDGSKVGGVPAKSLTKL